jgi:hypothetical protein
MSLEQLATYLALQPPRRTRLLNVVSFALTGTELQVRGACIGWVGGAGGHMCINLVLTFQTHSKC